MDIHIKATNIQPEENAETWSYPISELDYLLETAEEGATYLLYNGRLYEEVV